MAASSTALTNTTTEIHNVDSPVRFAVRPDVHLLSMESLQSPRLLNAHLGLDGHSIQQALARDEFSVFRNVFTRFPSTVLSLNSLLDLDATPIVRSALFSGKEDSVVYRVFRSNGYKVISGYANSYLGTQGTYVDAFTLHRADIFSSSACLFTADFFLKLFSICEIARVVEPLLESVAWDEAYLDILRSLPRNEPVFTFHHMLKPGHTGHLVGAYDHTDHEQRRIFLSRYQARMEEAAALISRATSLLTSRNRPFILFVFSDHGAWISRAQQADLDDPFIVRDRHGSFAAILAHEISVGDCDVAKQTSTFTTPARIMSRIIECLSDGTFEQPGFIEPVDFSRFTYE